MVSERILVISTQVHILAQVGRELLGAGYQVETAGDGKTGLERIREGAFALALLNLDMLHDVGLRVLEGAQSASPRTIVVLIAGPASIDSAAAALGQGAYDYLVKPLDRDRVLSTVRRALRYRELVLQNERLSQLLQDKGLSSEPLHRAEQRESERLRQVNAIAREITTILDVDTLTRTVVSLIGPAFGFHSPSFGLIDGADLVFAGGQLDGQTVQARESVFWQLTDGGREAFVRYPRARETRTGLDMGSVTQRQEPSGRSPYDLVFPLCTGEQIVGFWVANWQEGAEFREENLPYLESLAAQTVAVLRNARLYGLARQADELAFLNEFGRVANQSLDLEETIQCVLACVQTAFNAALAEICLFGTPPRENAPQEVQYAFGLVEGELHQSDSSLLGSEFIHRIGDTPLLVRGEEESVALPPAARSYAVRALLGVTLQFGARPIGVLAVGSADPDAYDLEDGRLLQVVGGHAATAIENARLFREVESVRRIVQASRNILQVLFDGIPEGICIVDRNKKVLAINRTQADWAGRGFRELVGYPAEYAFPSSRSSLSLIEQTFRAGKPLARTERQKKEDGEWAEWEIRTYPVTASRQLPPPSTPANGRRVPNRVIVVIRDVTEQRWLETSLLQSEKLAALGTLAAGFAHEINNPMAVISTNAQILRQDVDPDSPHYPSVKLIERASERASKIVRNLLDFSRSEQFEFVPTDLGVSIIETVSLVEAQFRKANIEIECSLAPDLPSIDASPDHLHVAWLNLLLNARDAIEETGHGGHIRISAQGQEDHVVVRVSDDGVGMPQDVIHRIYDPFFTTKGPGKGTGLGLFSCYRTVVRHGGEVSVESLEDQGTVFEIVLPVRQPPPPEA